MDWQSYSAAVIVMLTLVLFGVRWARLRGGAGCGRGCGGCGKR